MNILKKVWVLAEKQAGLGQLCAGGRQLGEEVSVILWGEKEEADQAIRMGADKVYRLGVLRPEPLKEDYVETILKLLQEEKPDALFVQPTKRGKLIAGRLAAGLGTSALVDAVEILTDGDKVQIQHMVYGGAAFRTERIQPQTAIVTIGTGVFTPLAEDSGHQGTVIEVEFVEPAVKIKLLEKKSKASAEVNLNAAKRVVGVGRGLVQQEDLRMVEELAGLLEAEVGCSRPIAEGMNWLPKERYIGVSGAMLKPDLYLALGISGQVQHMVGVNQAKVIVAINKDKAAPIFSQADYGIVGDFYKVLPSLIEKFKAEH
ncbi:Electron transfer flavoprotein alpha subunit [Desulfitobacterium hafniense DCB-2]|uniref:Electron transfer flavoprotein alpha subunit n=1 Tax=Desulfitobacterium hafniense (strain DSM 10664 / DCB-2) TaxID=272564 RepID=B8FZK6_DESHD|nr:FAD-binding protein [Desulfitobacterium hafniense]ACL19080.1 Electron transfer flavoprotein alpha subunit [Desulfitobacterium hafniense DCB-2]